MSHEDYKEMLAEHALDALDANEARVLEEHLSTCAACRAELAEWRNTTAALAFSARLAEPPPALRSRLLENVRATKAQSSNDRAKNRNTSTSSIEAQATLAPAKS